MDTIISHSVEETRALGARWAREEAGPGSVFALVGDLGAGKTEFVRGFAGELGVGEEISSPTFTLVHEHEAPGGLVVVHADLYRLRSVAEVIALGWDDLFDEGSIVLVEWADRFPSAIPRGARWIGFEEVPGGRRIGEREGV